MSTRTVSRNRIQALDHANGRTAALAHFGNLTIDDEETGESMRFTLPDQREKHSSVALGGRNFLLVGSEEDGSVMIFNSATKKLLDRRYYLEKSNNNSLSVSRFMNLRNSSFLSGRSSGLFWAKQLRWSYWKYSHRRQYPPALGKIRIYNRRRSEFRSYFAETFKQMESRCYYSLEWNREDFRSGEEILDRLLLHLRGRCHLLGYQTESFCYWWCLRDSSRVRPKNQLYHL